MKGLLKRKKGKHQRSQSGSGDFSASSSSGMMPTITLDAPSELVSSGDDRNTSLGSAKEAYAGISLMLSEEMMAEEDARKLEHLSALLRSSNATTSRIVEALESVEERISGLEAGIAPVHKLTSRLRTRQNSKCLFFFFFSFCNSFLFKT